MEADELAKVLEERKSIEQAQAELDEWREKVNRNEAELRHQRATNLVNDLFGGFAEFSEEFTQGVVYQRYKALQRQIENIKEHDPAFPKSLSEGKYQVDSAHFEFWVGCLQKFIAVEESLEKFLRGVYSTRTHGTPFSNEE
jgi:hypothetical protein